MNEIVKSGQIDKERFQRIFRCILVWASCLCLDRISLVSYNLSGILAIAVYSKASHDIESYLAAAFFVTFAMHQFPCGRGIYPVTNSIVTLKA